MFSTCVFFVAAAWYGFFLGATEVPKLKPAPLKETRTIIALVDTGVDQTEALKPFLCNGGHISLVDNEPLQDDKAKLSDGTPMKHGTNLAGLITKGLDSKKYCLLVIKFYDPDKDQPNLANAIFGIKYAAEKKATYLNLSLGGVLPNDMEERAIRNALKQGLKISVAAGNDSGTETYKGPDEKEHAREGGQDLSKKCDYFPACYEIEDENFHVVGSSTGYVKDGVPHTYSNYGGPVKYHEDGTSVGNPVCTGTSQATAIHLNKWIQKDSEGGI